MKFLELRFLKGFLLEPIDELNIIRLKQKLLSMLDLHTAVHHTMSLSLQMTI